MNNSTSERTALIVGEEGLEILKKAHVVIAGAGAVGGYAIEGLVRAGIGNIRVIDGDVVSYSNINRQILATYKTIGIPKATLARSRCESINPEISFEDVVTLINTDTDLESTVGHPDVLVDAIDTVSNKALLLRYAAENNIRTFSSMGAALHTDTRKIKIDSLRKTKVCPLASSVRSKLRDIDISCITCVYSEEPPITTPTERDDHGKSILGSLPTIPAIFGMMLANETIFHILGSTDRDVDQRPDID